MDNNWTINQTKKLFKLAYEANAAGKGLISAFSIMATDCNKSVNSVRNYYYSQLKMFQLVPQLAVDLGIRTLTASKPDFEFFSEAEISNLVKSILIGKANGKSVRATIGVLSNQDSKQALRLQNKFRSLVTHHRGTVNAIMLELSQSNVPYFNPYLKETVCGTSPDNHARLTDYISTLNTAEVDDFLALLKKLFA